MDSSNDDAPQRSWLAGRCPCQYTDLFEIELEGRKCALKLFHDNGDPGFTENGLDLNRFCCELNAYMNLREHGVCERGFVPYFYGHVDQLPNAESLNCESYSEACYHQAIEGMKQIHAAYVHHRDIYPKNILVIPGDEERMVWVDSDVAIIFTTAGPDGQRLSEIEDTYVAEFGEFLREDQRQGLCTNTRLY
ncbi:hypothetical protein BDV37DRAFT_271491 [Aspergillus pseudonomiae]|uniref:Protein kinase domain-containing protein n=1 Tax=Aspergillus pseudonomiae TaxID=1506151 RepID=A0A5N7DDU9_9EURO|nr:uncharacterized protein BDV37DRAFT_271491 [Aspergillus pseudonomiae]KAE8404419.1 hypothetical protein BDV37DRAFT_271491 [Aspergillus pseudonomiae]